jgi:O-antigen ligase
MTPFYNDHTSYGAILAMYIPVIFYYFRKEYSQVQRLFVSIVLIIFLVAIILSYTRAAWVSLIGALGIYIILFFRIKFTYLFAVASFILILFFSFKAEIIMKLEKNTQDSSQDLGEHVQSISNISSDASNLERINRWNSAIKMFKERPIFGWGPGTYMFQYAPFQSSEDLTTISTNGANLGNAHSEYIGPLAEQGAVGTLAFIIILIVVFYTGVRFYQNNKNQASRKLVLVAMLALSTYYIHGLLNNFLDTDKASAPFWGFIALITALDIHAKNEIE